MIAAYTFRIASVLYVSYSLPIGFVHTGMGQIEMARKTKKALTMQFLDAATMSLKTVHLFDVSFAMKDGSSHVVQVYAPSDAEVMDAASRLYANKGAFGDVVAFNRAEAR